MTRYFKKEEPRVKLRLPNGASVPIDFQDRDNGYLKTSMGWLVAELEKAMKLGVGGVSEISEEEYLTAQKKRPENSLLRQREQIVPLTPNLSGRQNQQTNVGVAGIVNTAPAVMRNPSEADGFATPQRSEGLRVPKQFVKPRLGPAPKFEIAD
jgi:hypothetical protein